MKNRRLFVFMFVFLIWFVYWEDTIFTKPENLNYVPWEIIVKYRDQDVFSKWWTLRTMSSSEDWIEGDNLEVKETFDNLWNIALVEIKDDKSVEETIELLKNNPEIEYAEPNYIRYLFASSCISNTGNQWALNLINRNDAYNIYSWALKKTAVPVAVVDNWVDYNHDALKNSMRTGNTCIVDWKQWNCIHWYDFFHNQSTPLPNWWTNGWHGTHVAGIIAANQVNWVWPIGINPYAKIVALKIWRWRQLSTSDELRAIQFAIDNNIKIINASYWATWSKHDIEKNAINLFWENWWLFVVAAGNDWNNIDLSTGDLVYPCAYDLDNILCVASVNDDWIISSFSNTWIISVDIAAPWNDICSTYAYSWESIKGIFTGYFDDCTYDKQHLDSRNTWECYKWSNYNDFWYYFNETIESPVIDLSNVWNDYDVYLSFYLSCAKTDLRLSYDKWDWYAVIEPFSVSWSNNYSTVIPSEYITNDFSFKLENQGNWLCVIDDIEIYTDPYVVSDNSYWKLRWTSMATPYVAWLASLVWAINPELTNIQVKNLILENWSITGDLSWKLLTWKVINVNETLRAAAQRKVSSVTWLQSSWTGNIKWDAVDWVHRYYYEVLSWDTVVMTWFVENELSTWLDLTWSYTWIIQWIDELWNKSDFSTWYICPKPILSGDNLVWTFQWYECSTVVWNLNYNDACSSSYEVVWSDGTWAIILSWVWTFTKNVFIRNWLWEETDQLVVYYTWLDSLPTASKTSYTYVSTITSTSSKNIPNLVSIFWVQDWACGTAKISVDSVDCGKWQRTLNWNNLQLSVPSNEKWSDSCTITFRDDEWNDKTWTFNYSFNTVQSQTTTNWWWGWWGWGGWWGWWWSDTSYSCKNLPNNATANNKSKPTKSDTNYSYSINTSKVCTFQCNSGYTRNEKNNKCEKVETTTWSLNTGTKIETSDKKDDNSWVDVNVDFQKEERILEIFEEDVVNNSSFDFSRYNNANPSSIQSNWYTVEFNNAYEFAYRAWITTISPIQKANMNWSLTRIAMAKMLSNYAINVLWKVPSNSIVPNFPDVSSKMNEDYWWAVTLSYQLWIMWKWINKFRPNDIVSRAEFGTALSRMLYWTQDWSWKYYSTHLDKLYKEWVISNKNPDLKELRWYVMIMLMRSAKK